jgi:hypothetical protein
VNVEPAYYQTLGMVGRIERILRSATGATAAVITRPIGRDDVLVELTTPDLYRPSWAITISGALVRLAPPDVILEGSRKLVELIQREREAQRWAVVDP